MAISGILMRLMEQRADYPPQSSSIPPAAPCLHAKAIYHLGADDAKSPSSCSIYFLDDISPILHERRAYDKDVQCSSPELSEVSWIVCAFINGRDKSIPGASFNSGHATPALPSKSSVVVVNGSTPRADKEIDYHDWYDHEHGEKLTLVPGWNWARRYKLMKVYGDIETANFYGINLYDEKNGLGGAEWQSGVNTEWTLRIRSNAAKPNIRRVWKVVNDDNS